MHIISGEVNVTKANRQIHQLNGEYGNGKMRNIIRYRIGIIDGMRNDKGTNFNKKITAEINESWIEEPLIYIAYE